MQYVASHLFGERNGKKFGVKLSTVVKDVLIIRIENMNQNKLKDDIRRLSKGKASRSKIGSRAVPHRLTQEEQKQIDLAMKKGFLEVQEHQRINAQNIYQKYAQVNNWLSVVIVHGQESSTLYVGDEPFTFSERKEAKQQAKDIAKQNTNR